MDNPEKFARIHRLVAVAHGEAFQLMLYKAEDGSAEFWVWNSRDGVTPFWAQIDGMSCRHAMVGYVTEYSAVLPEEAAHVWVDYTPDAWRAMLHRRWQRFKDHPKSDFHDPAKFIEEFPTPESFEQVEPYRKGEPMLLARAEFLEATHSWMGRPNDG